eukprot:3931283-Prymnesium_polylepis.1
MRANFAALEHKLGPLITEAASQHLEAASAVNYVGSRLLSSDDAAIPDNQQEHPPPEWTSAVVTAINAALEDVLKAARGCSTPQEFTRSIGMRLAEASHHLQRPGEGG